MVSDFQLSHCPHQSFSSGARWLTELGYATGRYCTAPATRLWLGLQKPHVAEIGLDHQVVFKSSASVAQSSVCLCSFQYMKHVSSASGAICRNTPNHFLASITGPSWPGPPTKPGTRERLKHVVDTYGPGHDL